MTASSTIRLMTPEEIAVGAGARAAPLRLPEPGLFAERALRLRHLAEGHAMRDYLLFAAELAQRQHEQLKQPRTLVLPNELAVGEAAAGGLAPLDALRHARDPVWREELRELVQAMAQAPLPEPARLLVQSLATADDDFLEQQAQALLAGGAPALDPATAPLIGAALQLHWVRLVQQLQARYERSDKTESLPPFSYIDDPTVCPCCGSRPVASMTRISGETSGQRFLACSLCGTQWHYVRIKCTHCQGTKGISFQQLVDEDGKKAEAVQAECCETCGHYLKQVHMEKDLQVEPLADDLATLTLDLLVGELGLVRQGFNPLLILGEPDVGHDSAPALDPPPDPGGH
ncbi:formate dehydrogenase accessory protein FdhE [Roseateles amylovorans]|jgi:FdhE protein|uniref:Protein FdhE homolog n=1 Tax=Roseateles amylovorans TaxID=2978473 RepID=A0ABY6B3U3_9BURK|nr:formate dehydrogenase accessory protein FdhE [Roseateles amylovorans]UXH79904.1 formate dehydrogenase accessory protein FdhE [Roseateles amylovorans]